MIVKVNDKMQRYSYKLTAPTGRQLDFAPAYTPKQMLAMGVFEGKYCRDCRGEFPASWFTRARFAKDAADPELNYFKIKSRLSLQEWRRRGWIPIAPGDHDVRGWFQWYMRYYYGRRQPEIDKIQIARWRAITRHSAQVKKHCTHQKAGRCSDPLHCRPRQRQVLLQWSWDCLI